MKRKPTLFKIFLAIISLTIFFLFQQSKVSFAKPLGIPDLLGNWESANGPVTIDLNGNKMILKGKYLWEEVHTSGQSGFVFTYSPKAQGELNPEIPDWARSKVIGKLKWIIELEGKRSACGYNLTGRWYPGEIRWAEKKFQDTGKVQRDAEVVGKGSPIFLEFTRSKPDDNIKQKMTLLENLIEERKKEYNKVLKEQNELDMKIRKAESSLNYSANLFTGVLKFEEVLEKSLEKAKSIEDVIGLVTLAGNAGKLLGKPFLKHLLKSQNFQKILLSAKGGNPSAILQLERALGQHGGTLSHELYKTAQSLDRMRWEAVLKSMEDMKRKLKKQGVDPNEFFANFTGSGKAITDNADEILKGIKEGKPEILDSFLSKLQKEGKWKGLQSDLDMQVPPEYAASFQKQIQDRLNAILKQNRFGTVSHVDQLKINTFTENLSKITELTPGDMNGLKSWLNRLGRSPYLANKDAYRTYGSQKLADFFTGADRAFSRLDGADIVYEMSSRAHIAGKTAGNIDGPVFKEIFKNYERALAGADVAFGKTEKMGTMVKDGKAVFNLGENAKSALKQLGAAEDLYNEAKKLANGKQADPVMARKMLDQLDALKRKFSAPAFGDPAAFGEPRSMASIFSRQILDAELAGKTPGISDLFMNLVNKAPERMKFGLDIARNQWADELNLPSWLNVTMDPKYFLKAGGGVSSYLFNPLAHIGSRLALDIIIPLLSKIMGEQNYKEFLKEERSEAESSMSNAERLLSEADASWWFLSLQFDKLKSTADLHEQLEALTKGMNPEEKSCFEKLAHIKLEELDNQYKVISDYVNRLRNMIKHFRTEDMVKELETRADLRGLEAKLEYAKKELQKAKDAAESYKNITGKTPGYFGPHQAKIDFAQANYDYYKNLIDGFHKLKEILPKSLKFSDLSGSISRSSSSDLTLPQIKSLAFAMAELLKGMEDRSK